MLACGQHGSAAFAKAYAGCAGLLAPAGKDHGIAVEQKGAGFAIGQGQRFLISSSAPASASVGPDSVPVPSRSPERGGGKAGP